MKKIVLLIPLLIISSICFSQNATTKASLKSKEQLLKLTIKSDKEVYVVGEIIALTLNFENVSGKEIMICTYPKGWVVSASMTDSKGKVLTGWDSHDYINSGMMVKKPMPHRPNKEDFVKIKDGENFKYTIFLNMIIGRWLQWIYGKQIIEPDVYSLKIQYASFFKGDEYGFNAWTGTLISNIINLEVINKKEQSLQFTIIPDKKVYSNKEPINVTCKLKNVGEKTTKVDGYDSPYLSYQSYNFVVYDVNGRKLEPSIGPFNGIPHGPNKQVLLSPNDSYSISMSLVPCKNNSRITFPELRNPNQYYIQGRYNKYNEQYNRNTIYPENVDIVSDVINIEVNDKIK